MEENSTSKDALRDVWTHDVAYRRCYQTEDDVESILRLLALTPQSNLIDVGCGNGAFAIAAAQRYPGCRVWAFDALDTAVAECKAKAAGLAHFSAATARADSIPLVDACADRALFRSVLHHLAEPLAVYREMARVLKPGGRLVLQAPCDNWEGNVGQVLSEVMMLADDSHRRFYYRPTQIVAGLEQAGFSAGKPECWPYEFPFIEEKEAILIKQHNAQEALKLRLIGPGKWSITGWWTRVVAERAPIH